MIVIAILGLWLPGYALARALRATMAWAAAFPLSAILLAEIVIAYTVVGVPLTFGHVSAAVVASSLLGVIVWFLRKSPSEKVETFPAGAMPSPVPKALLAVIAVQVGLVLSGMLMRTALFPLSGFDTPFRWDGLARLMFEYNDLSYYPPVTADDYTKYVYADSMPPLTATIYWWLYAAWGQPLPSLTAAPVILQAVSCLALVFYCARMLFGSTAGLIALGTLASSTLFLTSVAMGQETGYTALSFAGQFAFAFAAVRNPKASLVVIAGLFAGLGTLSRDYCLLLSLCGFAILACRRETRRYLPLFCLVVVVSGGPWYLRNWMRTGNPTYPVDIGLGFPVNPAHAGMMAWYRELRGVHNYSVSDWIHVATTLLIGAPLALLLGVSGMAVAGNKAVVFALSVIVMFFLLVWSIPYTGGGFDYAVRILSPAWVALSIIAGACACWSVRSAGIQRALLYAGGVLAVVLCGGYAVLSCWSHPFSPAIIREAVLSTRQDPLDSYVSAPLINDLANMNLPPGGILTDDFYLAVGVRRYTRFQPVIFVNPLVEFSFESEIDPIEVERRLVADRVWCIAVDGDSFNNGYLRRFPFYRQFVQQLPEGKKRVFFFVPSPEAAGRPGPSPMIARIEED
jgi:hypothetical protein